MFLTQDEKESYALRLRLKFEMGVISKAELQKEAASWSPQLRDEMRALYRASVASVSRKPMDSEL